MNSPTGIPRHRGGAIPAPGGRFRPGGVAGTADGDNIFVKPLNSAVSSFPGGVVMKVRSSIKRICGKCKMIKRKGVVRIICEDPRHKQRQG